MEKFIYVNKVESERLPKNPGIYEFKNNEGKILYIGKAANIKERVKNHLFQPNYKDRYFIDQISRIGYIQTDSEIEALLLEANLIKKRQPKYNVAWRDDKYYFFVGIARKPLPVVFITHQTKIKDKTKQDNNFYIGPFTEGRSLRKVLKFLRRAFPYLTVRKHGALPCFYCHIGQCPGADPDIQKYRRNIRNLVKVLKGDKKTVLIKFRKEMKIFSDSSRFEEAAKARDQIRALENVMTNARIIDGFKNPAKSWSETQKVLQKIISQDEFIRKIEAYDISNIQGSGATGSMVTFSYGKPDKNFYRKFKIRLAPEPNDVAMIKEILTRRLAHAEWPFPEVILIDGGKPQLNAALSVVKLNNSARRLKVIALAKRKNELFLPGRKKSIMLKSLPREVFNLILRLRDEAHRFAITYHRKLRDIDLKKHS